VALQEKGLGIAEALADKGMTIVIVGRIGEKAEAAADKIRANGVRAFAVPMDVRDREATLGLATRVKEEVGGVEILVLNAAVTTAGPLVDPIPEEWDWVLDIVLGGPARGLQAFLTAMIDWVTDTSWSPPTPWSVLYRISSSCMDPTQHRKRWQSGW